MDDQQRERLREDLKGFIKGELLFDDLTRALYSTDASIFQVRPAGVVVPRDEADVTALARYAAEHKVPLVPRGAGTGMAGEALGAGLVVDLSRHFRQILAVEEEGICVQPGVTWRAVNERLAPLGRRFVPDPASGESCTVGGMVANNASGANVLRHGYTRDHIAALRMVLDSGDAVTVAKEPLTGSGDHPAHLRDIVSAVAVLLEQNEELIRRCRPRTPFNRCGYQLDGLLTPNYLDMAKLLVGSEGTLGLFTEATLRTQPIPKGRSLLLLCFGSLDEALRAVQMVLPSRPTACELIDRRLLRLARGSDASATAASIPAAAEAVLLIVYEADTPLEARRAVEESIEQLHRHERLAFHSIPAFETGDIDRLWRLREVALPTLYSLRGGSQPVAMVEDVGVPPEELASYLHRLQDILQEQETTASFLIHAGSGQVHTRPFLDLNKPEDVSKLALLSEKIHGLALELGGTVSTQHGTGLARTPWVARQYGDLYPVFRQLKAIFDPQGIFNPGKIVTDDSSTAPWPLRTAMATNGEAESWLLRWPAGELRGEITSCNGCGTCRTEAAASRMCPMFHVMHTEAASPRAKANLLRHLLQEKTNSGALSADEVREVADLCVNCKMCAQECPAHVNIPKLMLEAKAANVAEHGLNLRDWLQARTETFARLASAFALPANLALGSPWIRWLLEKVIGLARQRRLPRFASRTFLQQARRRGWTQRGKSSSPRLTYFVDLFADLNDPLIAEAVVAVLRHHGFDVYVPPDQLGSGMAHLAYGDLENAREVAEHNIRVLAESARDGHRIVCSEPTAALMLKQDYLDLVDNDDARLVAAQTIEFTELLGELHDQGSLRTDFRPLDLAVGHHVPCHLKALGRPPRGPELLGLIPGLRVHTIDVSCSGMAGTFGLGSANYPLSLAAGQPMLRELSHPRILFGSTECGTCRMQMEDGAHKRTMHPAQYLALAYGLMPEVARRLKQPLGELLLS